MSTNRSKYILYADDDSDDREVLTDFMHTIDKDLQVVTVENGQLLVNFLNSLTPGEILPCFIILDINMPVMNGMEALSFLKSASHYKNVPVMMYTTSQDQREMDKASTLGADGFIVKPFDYEELESAIAKFASFCHTVPEFNKP